MYPYPQTGSGTTYPPSSGNMPRGPHLQQWNRGYMSSLKLAPWPWRVAAGAIDYVPAYIVESIIAAAHLVALSWLLFFGWVGFNNVYMQGMTGQSLGKRLVGIRLVSAVDSGPTQFELVYPGIGRCCGRQLAHLLDLLFFPFCIGLFRPLWQRQYKTFADSIAKTVVVDRQEPKVNIGHRQPGQATTNSL